MKRIACRPVVWTVLILFLFVLVPRPAFAYDAPDYDAVSAQLEADVRSYQIPGMAVIVVGRDEVLFAEAYGNCESIDTPFLIGSLSKSFTALAVLQLAEQGRIDLDAPISAYLDASSYLRNASEGDRITVRQLLHHTSGLGTYQSLGSAQSTDSYGTYTYANVNYGLLGKIIEAVSGESYADYVERSVFSPLGMEHSSASLEDSRADGLIAGYRTYFGIPVAGEPDYPDDRSWSTVPAGYISSSASDMGKYLQMYLNHGGGVISRDSLDTMFTDTVPQGEGSPYFYGMGWVFSEEGTEPVFSHSGLVENYASNMYLFPERGIGVAVLVNRNDYLVGNNLMNTVLLHLLGEDLAQGADNRYLLSHMVLNLCFLLVLFLAALPLLLLGKWRKKKHTKKQIAIDAAVHAMLSALLLLLPRFVGVPLWVVWYFVRDVFFVLVISAFLLQSAGLYKVFAAFRQKWRGDG